MTGFVGDALGDELPLPLGEPDADADAVALPLGEPDPLAEPDDDDAVGFVPVALGELD